MDETAALTSGWSFLSVFAACFAPSLFWLGYWYQRARLGRGGVRLALFIFAAGLLAGPLAIGLFEFMELSPFYEQLASIPEAGAAEQFVYTMFAIGPVEEISKFLVVWLVVRLFREHSDPLRGGPTYAAAAALGFATIENWYYMLEVDQVIWHRALTLPFNHVLFSSFWGIGITLAAARPRTGRSWLVATLVLSMVFHGLYDFILINADLPPWLVVPLILGLWIWSVAAIRKVQEGIGPQGAPAREPRP